MHTGITKCYDYCRYLYALYIIILNSMSTRNKYITAILSNCSYLYFHKVIAEHWLVLNARLCFMILNLLVTDYRMQRVEARTTFSLLWNVGKFLFPNGASI